MRLGSPVLLGAQRLAEVGGGGWTGWADPRMGKDTLKCTLCNKMHTTSQISLSINYNQNGGVDAAFQVEERYKLQKIHIITVPACKHFQIPLLPGISTGGPPTLGGP